MELEGREERRSGRVWEVQRAGGGWREAGERESVTCVMEATLLLGSTIFKERS